jgi:YVTN family beta-propeller protein
MIPRWSVVFLIGLWLTAGGCNVQKFLGATEPGPAARAGETTLYLQPCPPEAERLRFEIQGIRAVAEDGSRVALTPHLTEIRGAERAGRQVILAAGVLPPGPYRGVSLEIGKAFLLGEDGESALLVAEQEVTVPQAFLVTPGRSTVLFLTLLPRGNVDKGIQFTPSFTLTASRSDLVSLVGYVTNSDNDSLTVFNKVTMNITGAISTGRSPRGIVLDSLRKRAYVALAGEAAVQVIDLFKETVEGTVPLIFGDRPEDLALTPDGRTLVVVNRGSNTVSLIDALSLFETRRVSVGQGPVSVVIPRDGQQAFVMNSLSNSVSVLDLVQGAVTRTFSTDGSPLRGAFDPGGRKLFLIYSNIPYLTALDQLRFASIEKTFIGMGATFITASFPSSLVLVAMAPAREISVIDPFASVVINSLGVPGRVSYMVYDSQENSLFAVFPEQRMLRKMNVINGTALGELQLASGAYAVAVMGEN